MMNQSLCDAFIKICTEHYHDVYNKGMTEKNKDFYGTPPESMIIAFGLSQNSDDWKPLTVKEAVFRYSSQGLLPVPPDTAADQTEIRMYCKEAYAELCYQENGIAYMMIQFGKRYARCYRYDIVTSEDGIHLVNEQLLWVT